MKIHEFMNRIEIRNFIVSDLNPKFHSKSADCNALHTLKLEGNPYCNSGPHIWRTAIVVAAPSLNLLNGKEIAYTEKLYHRQIEERKRKRSPPLPG